MIIQTSVTLIPIMVLLGRVAKNLALSKIPPSHNNVVELQISRDLLQDSEHIMKAPSVVDTQELQS